MLRGPSPFAEAGTVQHSAGAPQVHKAQLARRGIHPRHLPSPARNRTTSHVFGHIKHRTMPYRTFTRTGKSLAALPAAFRQINAQPACSGSYSAPAARGGPSCWTLSCTSTLPTSCSYWDFFWRRGVVTVRHDMP